jgi:hypothetical protein
MEECAAACRKGVKQNVRKSIECKVTPRKEDVIDIRGCYQRTAVCLQSDVSSQHVAVFAFCDQEIPPLSLLRLLLLQVVVAVQVLVVVVVVVVIVVVVVAVTVVQVALSLRAGCRVLFQALTNAVSCFLHRQCSCGQSLSEDRRNQNAASTVDVR